MEPEELADYLDLVAADCRERMPSSPSTVSAPEVAPANQTCKIDTELLDTLLLGSHGKGREEFDLLDRLVGATYAIQSHYGTDDDLFVSVPASALGITQSDTDDLRSLETERLLDLARAIVRYAEDQGYLKKEEVPPPPLSREAVIAELQGEAKRFADQASGSGRATPAAFFEGDYIPEGKRDYDAIRMHLRRRTTERNTSFSLSGFLRTVEEKGVTSKSQQHINELRKLVDATKIDRDSFFSIWLSGRVIDKVLKTYSADSPEERETYIHILHDYCFSPPRGVGIKGSVAPKVEGHDYGAIAGKLGIREGGRDYGYDLEDLIAGSELFLQGLTPEDQRRFEELRAMSGVLNYMYVSSEFLDALDEAGGDFEIEIGILHAFCFGAPVAPATATAGVASLRDLPSHSCAIASSRFR